MKYLHFAVFTLVVISVGLATVRAQRTVAETPCGDRPQINVTPSECFKPVLFGKAGDGFPDKLKIKGVITRVTFTLDSDGKPFYALSSRNPRNQYKLNITGGYKAS